MSNKIKLLIATGIFPPDIGGPATYTQTLCEELPKLGFEVKVVTYSQPNSKFPPTPGLRRASKIQNSKLQFKNNNDEYKVDIYRTSRNLRILSRYSYYFWKIFKLCQWADVVYVQGPVSEGLPAWLACKLRRKKYILKIVGDYAWEQGSQRFGICDSVDIFQKNKYAWPVEFMRWIEKMVARGADKIVVPSFYLKGLVRQWGIGEDKIEVIYNAFDDNAEIIDKQKVRAGLGLEGDIILTAVRLVPWKGVGTLIDLMPELIKVNSNFKLVIIGAGPLKNDLEMKARNYNLTGKVIFTGRLEKESVREYMAAADFFILNSAYEGLSHVLLEAFASGLPVLASNAGGNSELIQPQKNGILFDYDDREKIKAAVLDLWRNKEKGKALVEEAKKNITRFSKKEMIDKTISVLSDKK